MKNWLTWSLLSAVFAGATAVLAKIGVSGVDSNFATAIRTTVILLFIWIIASFNRSAWSLTMISRRTWLFLVLSGIATGLSWLFYFRALQLGEASRVAPMDKLSVIFAILFAAIFLQETLTWHHWVGGGLVLAGAVILAFKAP
jgi:transporter family protein